MKLEIIMQEMYDNYPGLFKTKADCYNQLFLTIGGGGYKWNKKTGEFDVAGVDPEEFEKQYSKRLVDGKAFQYRKLSLRDEMLYYHFEVETEAGRKELLKMREMTEEEYDNRCRETAASLPADKYYRMPRALRWYCCLGGYSSLANICSIPKKLSPEYKAAIEELKTMLEEDGYPTDFKAHSVKPTEYKERLAKQKECLKKNSEENLYYID